MPLDPGISALIANHIERGSSTAFLSPEGIVGASGIPIPWGFIDGTQVRAGVSGMFTVTGAPVTIRVRIGGTPNNRTDVAGTIVHTFVVPVGSKQVFDELSPPVAKPGVDSYIQVTAEGVGATMTLDHLSITIVPTAVAQLMLLGTRNEFNGPWDNLENIGYQWLVDFDWFETEDLVVAFVARTFNAMSGSVRKRLRIGGTDFGLDGDVVIDETTSTGSFDGALTSGDTQIVKPTGQQFVKVSSQGSFGANTLLGLGILLKGV